MGVLDGLRGVEDLQDGGGTEVCGIAPGTERPDGLFVRRELEGLDGGGAEAAAPIVDESVAVGETGSDLNLAEAVAGSVGGQIGPIRSRRVG